MPKTTTWTGATDSDYDTSSNWSNGLPTASDTIVIDGAVDITGGSVTNDECERFYIASSYTGAVGSTGTPLEVDVAEVSVDNNTSGSTHYLHLTGSANTTPTVMVTGLKTGSALYISGVLDLVVVEPSFVGTMYIGNSASKTASIKDLVVLTSAGTVDASVAGNLAWSSSATINMASGVLNLGENIGTSGSMTVSGGTVNVSGWTLVDGDVFTLQGSGTVNWNAGSAGLSASAITTVRTLNLISGTFTTAGNDKAYVGLNDINQFGGTLDLRSSTANIDINGTFNAYAGTFTPSKQSVVTVSPK